LFLNLLQLNVGKRAATVADIAADAVAMVVMDAVAVADAVVEKIFIKNSINM